MAHADDFSWYRNAGRGPRYHAGRPDWIRSGRAMCGADISRPTYVVDRGPPSDNLPTCKRCKRLVAYSAVPDEAPN